MKEETEMTEPNMKLYVEGNFGGGEWKLEADLNRDELIRKAWKYLLRIAKTDPGYYVMDTDTDTDRFLEPFTFDFYEEFFAEQFEEVGGAKDFVVTRCSHEIQGSLSWERRWASLRIATRTQPTSSWSYEYRFAKISGDVKPKAEEITIHSGLKIEDNGSISGQGLYFKPFSEVWPLPLFDFAKYEPLGRLNYELSIHDTHPLTIAIRSPQPYKGLGQQIADRLNQIRNNLIHSYGFAPDNGLDKGSVLLLKKRGMQE